VEPDLLTHLVGRDDLDILEELARKNLFIQPVYDKKRGWFYRYHQLFRDFLLLKFKLTGEEARRAPHAGWRPFRSTGELEQAVKYCLEASAYPEAAGPVKSAWPDHSQPHHRLAQWLVKFPMRSYGTTLAAFLPLRLGRFAASGNSRRSPAGRVMFRSREVRLFAISGIPPGHQSPDP
jgi:hypothetical protein